MRRKECRSHYISNMFHFRALKENRAKKRRKKNRIRHFTIASISVCTDSLFHSAEAINIRAFSARAPKCDFLQKICADTLTHVRGHTGCNGTGSGILGQRSKNPKFPAQMRESALFAHHNNAAYREYIDAGVYWRIENAIDESHHITMPIDCGGLPTPVSKYRFQIVPSRWRICIMDTNICSYNTQCHMI